MSKRFADVPAHIGIVMCLVAALVGATADERPPIGIVNETVGRWQRTQKRTEDLRPGDLLYEGDTVFTRRTPTGSISVAILATGQVWRKDCTAALPCEGSYRPPSPPSHPEGIWAFLSGYWTSERKFPLIFAATRAVDHIGPRHAVVPAAEGRIDLTPALDALRPGSYTATLLGAPGSPAADAKFEKTVSVRIGGTGAPSVDGVAPGIYSLSIANESGQTLGATAAVLVARNAVSALQRLSEAKAAMASWTDVSSSAVDAMIVSLLYALDAEQRKP